MSLNLSKNVLQDVSKIVSQTREEAEICNEQFVKLKNKTINFFTYLFIYK